MSDLETIVRRYVAAWQSEDPAVFEELLAPEFADVMYGQRRTREQLLADAADTSFIRRTAVEDVLVDDDKVAARMHSHLTHRETGREASITGMIILRVVNGMIVEGWGEHDRLGQLQQMGVVPAGQALRPWIRARLGDRGA
jgi:ketosteroid isomerase-like protein